MYSEMRECIGESKRAIVVQQAAHDIDASNRFFDAGAKNRPERKVNLSTVISEALSKGLQLERASEPGEELLKAYQKVFACFFENEISILDGVILEPAAPRNQGSPRLGFPVVLQGCKTYLHSLSFVAPFSA